jgi:glycosyltransferase involved in cell wall biosynthesis
MSAIPVSVIVTTKNEEDNIATCLNSLRDFDEVIVVDSDSNDRTKDIAEQRGASVYNFRWNGLYPKKRQWCIDYVSTKHDRIFFVDADEVLSVKLCEEIAVLDWSCAGYFVQGQYRFDGRLLQHGLRNNKLVLFDKTIIEFPVVDDLGIHGMGEMEGHYQPVCKRGFEGARLGQIKTPLVHAAFEDRNKWQARHERYAEWEAGMNARNAWPKDPVAGRERLKRLFRALPFRGVAAFVQSYIWKLGFLDGAAGFKFAICRAQYYAMISAASKARGNSHGTTTGKPEPQL